MNLLKQYLFNILLLLTQTLNTLTGGDPDESTSSRLGKANRGDYGRLGYVTSYPFYLLVNSMFYPLEGWGHCERNIEDDEGGKDLFKEDI